MTERDPSAGAELLLDARGLTRRYGELLAADGIDLRLAKGEILGLLGPNGAGKTTSMNMVTGNLAMSAGSVTIRGADLRDEPLRAKRELGYLPETPPLHLDLRVDEYLRYAVELRRVPRGERTRRIGEALERCGLSEVSRRLIGNLSKGYQQRVGLAQAIVHGPEVLILDEPTVGLDPNQIREIRALVRELGEAHAVIFSSHILSEVQELCSRVQILNEGRTVFEGDLAALDEGAEIRLRTVKEIEEPSVLSSVPGVEDVRGVAGDYRIRPRPGSTPEPDIAALVVSNGWGLVRITRGQRSLEQLFVELTQREPDADDGEDAA